jgi:type III pantothenate kinase
MKAHRPKRRTTPEFLLIDAGNTRVKWAVAGRSWPKRIAGELATAEVSAKAIGALARKYPRHVTALACVVPGLLPAFRRAFGGRLVEANAATAQERFGFELRFAYPKPDELGADRIAAAVAAHAWCQYPAIIAACGTATAYTVLDAKGRLCGGAIAPGLQAQLDALLHATAQLPVTSLRAPRSALAKSTRDAIRTGVIFSFQGGVKETIDQLSATFPPGKKPYVILTGGNAELAAQALSGKVTLRPLLVMEGLLMIATRLWMPVP